MSRLDTVLEAHNRVAVDLSSGPTEVRQWDYPAVALQQISRNAVMHRAYEGTTAPVRIYWFEDRVEVHRPGGVPGFRMVGALRHGRLRPAG